MNASDVMTKSVITVRPETPVHAAAQIMLENHISGVPVLNAEGALCGILTEGDLLRRVELGTEKPRPTWLQFLRGPGRQAEDYVRSHARTVRDVMTEDLVTASAETPLEKVVQAMETHRVRRIPVVDAQNRLRGVVSRADLLRTLAAALPAVQPEPADDATLQSRVTAAMQNAPWARDGRVTVSTSNGTVTLEGIVFDARERNAMRVAAENVPGVRALRDQVTLVDPATGIGIMT